MMHKNKDVYRVIQQGPIAQRLVDHVPFSLFLSFTTPKIVILTVILTKVCQASANYILYPGLLTGCGRKIKIVRDFGANCAGKNVDCAGNCAGLRNLVTNQIFKLQCSSQIRQGGNSV